MEGAEMHQFPRAFRNRNSGRDWERIYLHKYTDWIEFRNRQIERITCGFNITRLIWAFPGAFQEWVAKFRLQPLWNSESFHLCLHRPGLADLNQEWNNMKISYGENQVACRETLNRKEGKSWAFVIETSIDLYSLLYFHKWNFLGIDGSFPLPRSWSGKRKGVSIMPITWRSSHFFPFYSA